MNHSVLVLATLSRFARAFFRAAGADASLSSMPLPRELEAHRDLIFKLAGGEAIEPYSPVLSRAREFVGASKPENWGNLRLESVFANIRLNADKAPQAAWYSWLKVDEPGALYPLPKPGGDLKALAGEFKGALLNMPTKYGADIYLDCFFALLEKYAWCVNSGGNVSLCDRARAEAALAQAFAASDKFLLFGGELSGIQKFIFGRENNRAGKGVNKLLRARSFLLQALARSVWLSLVRRLKLTRACRVMDAGGRFSLVLPASVEVKEAVAKLRAETEIWLLRNFGGSVKIFMNWLEYDPARYSCAGEFFEDFNDSLERARLTPWRAAFAAGAPVVAREDGFGENGVCETCRVNPAGENGTCVQCDELIKLGAKLPRAAYAVYGAFGVNLFDGARLSLTEKKPEPDPGILEIVFLRAAGEFSPSPAAGRVPVITGENLERWLESGLIREENDKFYYDGDVIRAGDPKTFGLIADMARLKTDRGWRSARAMAACKADADNLGLIFGAGFGGDFSLASFAMLARMFNLFFSFELARLLREEYPDIYVIFTGGDDLFVLGPWWQTVKFARRLNVEFGRFSANHPDVTISAGVVLFRPRLPARGVRAMAEAALDASKDKGKNSLTLFNVTAKWDKFDELLDWGERLEKLVLNGEISQGFLRRLLGYARQCREFIEEGKLGAGVYLSRLAYDLKRNLADKPELSREIRERANNCREFPKTSAAIVLALYMTRAS